MAGRALELKGFKSGDGVAVNGGRPEVGGGVRFGATAGGQNKCRSQQEVRMPWVGSHLYVTRRFDRLASRTLLSFEVTGTRFVDRLLVTRLGPHGSSCH